MVLSYSFTFDRKVIDDIIADLQKAPRRLQAKISSTIKAKVERAIAPLKVEPAQSPLPFVWSLNKRKQARAARWWFANKVPKGSAGGRYERTHGLVRGWQVDVSTFRNSVLIAVFNPASRAVKWTQSIFQIPSHERSGWQQYEEIILKAEEQAESDIIEAWYSVLIEGGK